MRSLTEFGHISGPKMSSFGLLALFAKLVWRLFKGSSLSSKCVTSF